MTPDDLRALLDEERGGRRPARDVVRLTVADRLDDDEERNRLVGGLL